MAPDTAAKSNGRHQHKTTVKDIEARPERNRAPFRSGPIKYSTIGMIIFMESASISADLQIARAVAGDFPRSDSKGDAARQDAA
jgi:hypothetical protein